AGTSSGGTAGVSSGGSAGAGGCNAPEQCVSLNCVSHVCQPATCSDGIKNGGEGDEDCGGPCPAKCAIGMQCGGASDCVAGAHSSAACVSGTCGLGTCTSGF